MFIRSLIIACTSSIVLLIQAQDQSSSSSLYYSVERDIRKCATPYCGGFMLTALNRQQEKDGTLCADGTVDEYECYVWELDLSNLGLSAEDEMAFRDNVGHGGIVLGEYVKSDRSEGVANLRVEAGWSPFEASSSSSSTTTSTTEPDCENCQDDEYCIYDPLYSDCFGCDCPTICVQRPEPVPCLPSARLRPGLIAANLCPQGLMCVDDPYDMCDPDCGDLNCAGTCVSIPRDGAFCGGIAAFLCNLGETCFDHQGDGCGPLCGADCGGVCIQEIGTQCGGIAGVSCGPGLVCANIISDQCSPQCGGADCGGVCIVESQLYT